MDGANTQQGLASRYEPVDGTEVLYATGHWLMRQRRFSDACEVLSIMLQDVPKDERPWLALGTCQERLKVHWKALELYATGHVVTGSWRCATARALLLHRLGRLAEMRNEMRALRAIPEAEKCLRAAGIAA